MLCYYDPFSRRNVNHRSPHVEKKLYLHRVRKIDTKFYRFVLLKPETYGGSGDKFIWIFNVRTVRDKTASGAGNYSAVYPRLLFNDAVFLCY